jgi:hypothetical protein
MYVFQHSKECVEVEFIVIRILQVCTSSLVLLHMPGSNPPRYLHLSKGLGPYYEEDVPGSNPQRYSHLPIGLGGLNMKRSAS